MIPLFRPPSLSSIREDVLACIDSGWWGYGPACHALEERFTTPRGGWALSTSSCTTALFLAAKAMRISDEDEVIVPAITFISTPMAFLSAGFRVKVADVDPTTLMINADTIRPLLSRHTRGVVAVHLYGQRAPVAEIRTLCDTENILLIEDCAHRLDLDDATAPVGDFACYSFNAVKEAPGGEGGLLWGRDSVVEARVRSMSNVGLMADTWHRSSKLQHSDYEFCTEVGLKLRLNDIAATIVNAMIGSRHSFHSKRASVFQKYDEAFRELGPKVSLLPRGPGDSYLMYVARVSGSMRDDFRRQMAAAGIATSMHYPSLSRHPLLRESSHGCPIAEAADTELVSLPCFPELSDEDQNRVINTSIEILGQM